MLFEKIKQSYFVIIGLLWLLSCGPTDEKLSQRKYYLRISTTADVQDSLRLYEFVSGRFVFKESAYIGKAGNSIWMVGPIREDNFFKISCKGNAFVFPMSAKGDTAFLNIAGSGDLLTYTISGGNLQQDYNAFLALQQNMRKKYDSLEVAAILAENMRNMPLRQNIENQMMLLDIEMTTKAKSFVREREPSLVSAWIVNSFVDPRTDKAFLDSTAMRLQPLADAGAENIKQFIAYVGSIVAAQVGQQAPEIALHAPDGRELKLSNLKGKVVLLDFWASWCGPCRADNPNLVRLYKKYRDKGFEIFGVSLDEDKRRWEDAISKDNITWIQVSDLKGWQSDVARKYGVDRIPYNFLLDRNGVIVAIALHGKPLEEAIEKLLNQPI